MTEFQRQTIVLALKDLAESKHFSICKVDRCLELAGMHQPEIYPTLHAMHCVAYSSMPKGYREELLNQVGSIFEEVIMPPEVSPGSTESSSALVSLNPNKTFADKLRQLIPWT